MQRLLLVSLLALPGCAGSDTDTSAADCLRPLDWRDALVVQDGDSGTVVVVLDCENTLTVTSVSLIGAGWDGDLPKVGDKIPAGSWSITVFHDGGDHPGEYTGELSIEAEGLDPEPAKPLRYVITGDTGDTGAE